MSHQSLNSYWSKLQEDGGKFRIDCGPNVPVSGTGSLVWRFNKSTLEVSLDGADWVALIPHPDSGGSDAPGFNVVDYGASPLGVLDSTSAINDTQTAAGTSTPCDIYFPEGHFKLTGNGIIPAVASKSRFKGAGAHLTFIEASATLTNWMMQGGSYREGITFEDITFDGKNLGNIAGCMAANGQNLSNLTFRRCRFVNMPKGIYLDGQDGFTMEDCWAIGQADATGQFINVGGGSRNFRIRRSYFLYWADSFTVDTGLSVTPDEKMADDFLIEDCHFDGIWWLTKSIKSHSGGQVTYTSGTLADAAGGWLDVAVDGHCIRAMEVHRTGTFTSAPNPVRMIDSGASFITNGVMAGEIVRSGSKFAIVSGVESQTVLMLEGWLDASTYFPADPPANGDAYTAYKVILGQTGTNLGEDPYQDTVVHVGRWFRTNGDTCAAPANGTMYEYAPKPNYSGVHFEYGAKNCRILRNTFLRSWSDQVSYYGDRGQIRNNIIAYGQDVGVTVNGAISDGHTSVTDNLIIQAGSVGVWIGSSKYNYVGQNEILRSGWINQQGFHFGGGVVLQGTSGNVAEGNIVDGQNHFYSSWGISVVGVVIEGGAYDNEVARNTIKNILKDEWQPDTEYLVVGTIVRNGNKQYRLVTPGTSGSIAPDGWTTNEMDDGTAGWDYYGTNAEILFTGEKEGSGNNRAIDNNTLLPVFHYSTTIPYDDSTYVEGSYYGTMHGNGEPEESVTAGMGTLWAREDVGELWLKATGKGNTGWVQLATS